MRPTYFYWRNDKKILPEVLQKGVEILIAFMVNAELMSDTT